MEPSERPSWHTGKPVRQAQFGRTAPHFTNAAHSVSVDIIDGKEIVSYGHPDCEGCTFLLATARHFNRKQREGKAIEGQEEKLG